MNEIVKKKISEITEVATSLTGLITIGVNANNESVQIPLQLMVDALVAAQGAAATAEDAATEANEAADRAENVRVQAVEMIAHDAAAPTPEIHSGSIKTYEFSTGGECAFITGGAVTVEAGDKMSAAFTEPSTWVYTYHNVLKRKADLSLIGDIEAVLDIIIEIQESIIGES
jgi:hypothetical protein